MNIKTGNKELMGSRPADHTKSYNYIYWIKSKEFRSLRLSLSIHPELNHEVDSLERGLAYLSDCNYLEYNLS